MNFTPVATFVAVALSAGSVLAADTQPIQKQATAQIQPQGQVEYPSVPSEYLRLQKTEEGKQKAEAAVEQLAQNVKKKDEKSSKQKQKQKQTESEARRSTSASVGQVSINAEAQIALRPGEYVFIPISREHPNRLLTPFKNPQVISTSLRGGKKGECGEVCVRDDVIYITTDSPSAVTAFITEKGHEDIAFSHDGSAGYSAARSSFYAPDRCDGTSEYSFHFRIKRKKKHRPGKPLSHTLTPFARLCEVLLWARYPPATTCAKSA